jgi:hypothetical protein
LFFTREVYSGNCSEPGLAKDETQLLSWGDPPSSRTPGTSQWKASLVDTPVSQKWAACVAISMPIRQVIMDGMN